MRQVSAALRAAIDSPERVIDSTFTVDWDNDGVQSIDDLSRKVDTISMTQSLESSLPLQVQVVPGVAVAEVTAKIARGNTVRYTVPTFLRALQLTSAAAANMTKISIARPANAKTGDVVLLAIFVSQSGVGSQAASWQPLRRSNVTWLPLAVRGDGGVLTTRVEGLLMTRRVADDEPNVYTLQVSSTNSTIVHGSYVAVVGDQDIMGITDIAQKGEDDVTTATSITLPQTTVSVPQSTVITFVAASSYAVSGTGFTPLDPADTERDETLVNGLGVSRPSLRVAALVSENADQGTYTKGVTITGSVGASEVATVGFSVVLAPKLAGDEAQHAAWTFSELNPNSPYAGKTRIRRKTQWLLQFITENGRESVPIFTGYTTAPSGASDRTVTIKALDRREDMRNTNQGMDILAEYPESRDSVTGGMLPTLPGLEATWMVSHRFFNAFMRTRPSTTGVFTYESQSPIASGLGFFPSPIGHFATMVWAPLHGSAHALFGFIQFAYATMAGSSTAKRLAFEVGPFVAGTKNGGPGSTVTMGWQPGGIWDWLDGGTGQFVGRAQMWVRRVDSTSTMRLRFADNFGSVHDAWFEVLANGQSQFRVERPGASRTVLGPVVPADSAWHFLACSFDSVAGSVRFALDSTVTTAAMATWANSAVTFAIPSANLALVNGFQVSELQIAGGFDFNGTRAGVQLTDAFANENFVPTAFIDKSENILDVLPLIDINDDTFSVIAAIANAEFAAFFFDEDGYPHFRTSRSDVSVDGQVVQRQITARRSIMNIGYESGVQQVRNVISVAYTPYGVYRDAEIFSASTIITVPAGTYVEFTVNIPGALATNVTDQDYSAFSNIDGTGTNLSPDAYFEIFSETSGQMTIRIHNGSGVTMYLVDNTGQPDFHVRTTYIAPLQGTFAPITYVDTDSIRDFNEQTLAVGASPWVQTQDSAAAIALKLLSDLNQPHPVITNLQIKGDPTLQFGDLVTVQDVNGLGVNGQYRITGKDPSLSPSEGFTQDLVVRSAAAVAYWDTNSWDDGTVWG